MRKDALSAEHFEVSGYEGLSSGFSVSANFRLRLTGAEVDFDGVPFGVAELVSGNIRDAAGEAGGPFYVRTRWEGTFDGGIVLYRASGRVHLENIGWFVGEFVDS